MKTRRAVFLDRDGTLNEDTGYPADFLQIHIYPAAFEAVRLLKQAGFDIKDGESPIVPVMLYNAKLAQEVARDLFAEGIYVVGFFFPVVAKGQARIRTQLSAAHEREHLDRAIAAFVKVGRKHGILGLTKQQIIDKFGL